MRESRHDGPAHKNWIRELRQKLGLSTRTLAERVDTTGATISRFETGKQSLSQAWLQKIAAALGVSAADLLDDKPSVVVGHDKWHDEYSYRAPWAVIEEYRQRLRAGGSLSRKELEALLDEAEQLDRLAADLAHAMISIRTALRQGPAAAALKALRQNRAARGLPTGSRKDRSRKAGG